METKYRTLKEVRHSLPLKFTQEQFARLIGASRPTIARWESGKAKISGGYYKLIYLLQYDSCFWFLMEENKPFKHLKEIKNNKEIQCS
jgi:transcriptional regulator with XRE-family HTH domain